MIGICCPVCGSETSVLATRAHERRIRRQRRCDNKACAHRLTTMEVVVPDGAHDLRSVVAVPAHHVVVSSRLLGELRSVVEKISPIGDRACGSPEDSVIPVNDAKR